MPLDPPTTDRLIVPYGIARVNEANLARVPRVEIDTKMSTPLRLGDGPYRRGVVAEEALDPTDDDDRSTGTARFDLIRRLHLRDCDVFDKYLRRWIDLYFQFVADQTQTFSAELAALSRAPEAMLDPPLWGMAALRPLPRAHIPAAGNGFVAVDVALWDGGNITAIVFAGSEKARRAQDLGGPVRLIIVDPPGEDDDSETVVSPLSELTRYFWRGLAVPPDPFGPAPFRLGAAAAPSF
ncbi:MAG: hypothetical protein GKS02_11345 [Alphaproteobacteria bacterium]|nr:hypothetical protein [Alphaproteobacteria bacterium]